MEDVDGMPEGERAIVEAYDATLRGAVVMGGGRAGFGDHEGGMVEVVRVMAGSVGEVTVWARIDLGGLIGPDGFVAGT